MPDVSKEYLNKRWYEYTGLPLEQAKGWGWKVVVHPDDLDRLLREWLLPTADVHRVRRRASLARSRAAANCFRLTPNARTLHSPCQFGIAGNMRLGLAAQCALDELHVFGGAFLILLVAFHAQNFLQRRR